MNAPTGQAKSIFLGALEIASAEELPSYLDAKCAGDAGLRREVEALLKQHAALGSFLDGPMSMSLPPLPSSKQDGALGSFPQGGQNTVALPAASHPPATVIGAYKLLQQIGEGGMGTVWLAQQTQPVQRQVALKIIKPGMDSRQVLVRFEAERQALALMDHPNIAKVFDGGATSDGRPYFVMELVKGTPITQYCDEQRLTPRQRLELFVPVCHAIQHAHQKGIIHRDIKPSNVLVAPYDGKPVIKVIDFGVAKATGQRLTEHTMFTEFGAVVGTVEYMSPEQAELNNQDIDTRSDIYALGVLLYELLTGTTPLTRKLIKEATLFEMLRIIREDETPRPSTRLGATEELPAIAAKRRLEPKKLSALVRGELDWIVMKALDKERGRRYETANGFALDVQRYLADEPVQACPPSAGYRLRKFVRRNKGVVVGTTAVLLTLVAGIVGTSIGLVRAQEASQTAAERAVAEQQAKEAAEAVLDFVETKIFAAARPAGQAGGLGREVTLRKAVLAALPHVKNSFKDQPLIEARLRMTIGISFLHLAEAKTALEQFEAARATYIAKLGHEHPDTLRSAMRLASSYAALGRGPEALELFEKTLALQEAKLGPNHRDTLGTLSQKALAYVRLGRYADALEPAKEVLARRKAAFGREDGDTLLNVIGVAGTYQALGRHAEALKVLEEETAGLSEEKLEPYYLLLLMGLQLRADSHAALGQHALALKLRREVFEKRKAKYGLDEPETILGLAMMVDSLYKLGRFAETVPHIDEFVARAYSKSVHLEMIPGMLLARFAAVRETKDPQSCRTTAEMWEKLNLKSVNYFYNAACMRAVTAGAFAAADKSPEGAKQADAEADRAMAWLKQAVAAGFTHAAHIAKDTDLDALRDRQDFKTLIAELRAGTKKMP
jgi:serine/threonine protein kinase